jgi:excisionase family DNA binding protein
LATHRPTSSIRRDTPATRPLLTADDVAQILGVPNSFVYALARRGELPMVRIGERYVRFRLDAIETWIAEHETLERRGTQ